MEIIKSGKENNALIVKISGRMDAVTAPEFEKALGAWIDESEKYFVVDLSSLEYISSAGLRSILIIAKKLKALNGKIVLAAMEESVNEVFEISGFNSIIPINDSVQAAIRHF
ncbi:MAG: STAS domain-containing protein [Deltaproteobacteria bacterium]|nr:STAS domain-containing protein [Deltaproteobacteria bacterium]